MLVQIIFMDRNSYKMDYISLKTVLFVHVFRIRILNKLKCA